MADEDVLALPGHDRHVALAMLTQARQRRNPIDEIQVRHLLAIGYRAGAARLAAAEKVVEALEPLIAASKASTAPRTPAYEAVLAAVDAYRAHERETTDGHG